MLVFGNTINTLLLAFLVLILIMLVGSFIRIVLVRTLIGWSKKSSNRIDDVLVIAVSSLGKMFYFIIALFVVVNYILIFPENIKELLNTALLFSLSFQFITTTSKLINFLGKLYIKQYKGDNKKAFETIFPSFLTITKFTLGFLILIFFLSNLGVNVTTLIAGFGIGGLAFAFAFQKILADLFSTFVIFFDKPFSIGDSISVGDVSGIVERVGLKTTKIRAFGGERVSLPNADLAGGKIINISDRRRRRVILNVPIDYSVSKTGLKNVAKLIEGVVKSKSDLEFDYAKITNLTEYAISLQVVYYALDLDYNSHMSLQDEIYTEILDELKSHKIKLGFPIEFRK